MVMIMGVGFILYLDAWRGFASLLRRAIFLCHLILVFHWIDGIGHTFYRATSLGCRGNTALEAEYHEELGFIYGTKFCVLVLLQFSILFNE